MIITEDTDTITTTITIKVTSNNRGDEEDDDDGNDNRKGTATTRTGGHSMVCRVKHTPSPHKMLVGHLVSVCQKV